MAKGFFITGTDTGVGKTVVTAVLGVLLQEKGYDVGVMKPVESGGTDTDVLRSILQIHDPREVINPYHAKEPLSPHLALERARVRFDRIHVLDCYRILAGRHDVMLVEGAGGLLVPLAKGYLTADLIRDLDLEVIIVSRLGLGTINHTLLTVTQARMYGLTVRGVIFSEQKKRTKRDIPSETNPAAIAEYGDVPILGTVPFLQRIDHREITQKCAGTIAVAGLLKNAKTSTAAARQLAAWDKKYIWHPFTQMKDWLADEPLVIDRGKGCYLFDTHGRRYLDGVSSLWVTVHGHCHPALTQVLTRQLSRLDHSTLLGLSNAPAVVLSKRLIDIAPKGLQKVFYSDSGSTAVEIAVKMAYQYWQNMGKSKKRKLMHLANSYHGDTLGSVSVGGIDLFHRTYRDLVIPTMEIAFPDCYRAPVGKKYPAYAFEHIARFEKTVSRRHHEIAAVIVEPIVQGAAGMLMWPKGILKAMETICKKHDIVFIVDEVATGFGRTGTMFACEQEDVHPDIMCVAKGLTGGYLPLAATLTTKRIFDGFVFPYAEQKTFFHGHTYTGNPLCCAAAIANLDVFEKERTLAKLAPKIQHLTRRLRAFSALEHVGDVRQRGFMVGIELVRDKKTKEPFPWQQKVGVQVCQDARRRGVILRPLGNVIVLMPPLAMSIAELNELLDATYAAIRFVTERAAQK